MLPTEVELSAMAPVNCAFMRVCPAKLFQNGLKKKSYRRGRA